MGRSLECSAGSMPTTVPGLCLPLYQVRVSCLLSKPLVSDGMPLGELKLALGDGQPVCLFLCVCVCVCEWTYMYEYVHVSVCTIDALYIGHSNSVS